MSDLPLTFLQTVLLSMVPGIEGRYSLVYGVIEGLSHEASLAASMLGTIVLSTTLPYAMSLIDRLFSRLCSSRDRLAKAACRAYSKYVVYVRRRAAPYVNELGVLGLIIFVAVPLPLTGVWTGSVAAYIIGLSRSRALLALTIGGALSNIIMFAITYGLELHRVIY